MILTHISNEVARKLNEERAKQKTKFGHEPFATPEAFIRIAGEEFGEICRAVNQGSNYESVIKETLHLAAVCIAFLDGDLHDGCEK